MEFTAEMIAGFLEGEIVGDKEAKVNNIAKIEEGTAGALSFLSNPKYEHFIYDSRATIIIVNKSFVPAKAVKATMIRVEDAYACFAKLLELYEASKPQKKGVSPQSAVSESATMGDDCYVGEFAVVGDNVKMGKECKIYPQAYVGDNVKMGDNVTVHAGVKIYANCVIGNGVNINAGAVIGADGFGFAPDEHGVFHKVPQIGNVILEDNVDIGANTCVDCATMGSTIIREGAKLDNLIQIGHNVVIGKNSVAAAQTGIAGSSKVGDNCMFGGQVGVVGHINIGNRVQIGSKSGISKDISEGELYFGSPAMQASKYHRSNAVFRNLPKLDKDVGDLKKQMKKILEERE